jgi:hypothetical protein
MERIIKYFLIKEIAAKLLNYLNCLVQIPIIDLSKKTKNV